MDPMAARGALAALLTVSVAAISTAEEPATPSYAQAWETLDAISLDHAKVAAVDHLVWKSEGLEVTLETGKLLSAPPFAVWVGTGSVVVTPPSPIEAAQLARTTGGPLFSRPIEGAAFFFGNQPPSAFENLALTGTTTEVEARAAEELFREARGFLIDPETKLWSPRAISALLNPERRSAYFVELKVTDDLPYFYAIDPEHFEPISVSRAVRSGIKTSRTRELLLRFAPADRYAAGRPLDLLEQAPLLASDYRIQLELDDHLELSAVTELTLTARDGTWRWIPLDLGTDLEVDSLRWDGDRAAQGYKWKDDQVLWVEVPDGLTAGAPRRLRVRYHGHPLEHVGDLVHVNVFESWYPRSTQFEPANFDLSYRVPKNLVLASVGREEENRIEGNRRIAHYVTSAPISQAQFEVGYFEAIPITDPRIPNVTVLWTESAVQGVEEDAAEVGMSAGKSMERQVAADVANSLALFQSYWGPPPEPKLTVVEAPRALGVAYPGLVCLDPFTFALNDRYQSNELFRSHEVAHQWWGTSLLTASYHDRWLYEGFAEYASLRYVLDGLRDDENFLRLLEDWRKEILGNRKYVAGAGQAAAPIWLGLRTEGLRTAGDSSLILYKKGAWVLHMLQCMFLDLKKHDEQAFLDLLSDFYRQYAGKRASTADFARVASEHFGASLDWFFDQWVYGSETPTYEVAHRVEKTADGFVTHVRVVQRGVDPTFRAYPILKVELPEHRFVRLRAQVVGESIAFDLPALPEAPEKLIFGDLESVLGEVKEVSY